MISDRVFLGTLTAIAIACAALIVLAVRADHRFESKCRAIGGTVIYAKTNLYCVKKEDILHVN